MAKSIHDEHRMRVRADFFRNGIDENTPPHKVMELLAFFGIPRKDTNEMAHVLINRFGSVSAVLDASPEQLMSVPGVGEHSAAFFHMLPQLFKIYTLEKKRHPKIFGSMEEVGEFLVDKYMNIDEEVFALTSLSKRGKLLSFDILERGDIDSVGVSIRKLVKKAIDKNSGCIVISHNHPGGIALPSSEDLVITEQVSQAVNAVGIPLLDHFIITDDDYVSLAQSPKYKELFAHRKTDTEPS